MIIYFDFNYLNMIHIEFCAFAYIERTSLFKYMIKGPQIIVNIFRLHFCPPLKCVHQQFYRPQTMVQCGITGTTFTSQELKLAC